MRYVVLMVAGVGNAVMAVPMVRHLARHGEVCVVAGNAAIGDVFVRHGVEVRVLRGRVAERLRAWRDVRGNVLVLPFPANRVEYTALAVLSRCGDVAMHDYPCGAWRTGRVALRHKGITAERGLHDVGQNLRLASSLTGVQANVEGPTFPLTDQERACATEALDVVIQPGCGDTLVGRVKRLPDATWARVADALTEAGRGVTFVEGPDERGVGVRIAAACASRPRVVPLVGTLGESAAVLAGAACFCGTDSGLAHVAAAAGVRTVTAFTAADPVRVAPWGMDDLVVTPRHTAGEAWQPRLLYPMDHPRPRLRPSRVDWASRVSADDLVAAVLRA